MNEEIKQAFVTIKNKIGDEIFTNEKKVVSLLSDLLHSKYIGERLIISRILSEKIPRKMLELDSFSINDIKFYADYISKKYFLDINIVTKAIELWYYIIKEKNNFNKIDNENLHSDLNLTDNNIKFDEFSEENNHIVQFNLAYNYQYGIGVVQDYKQAFNWYKKLTNKCNADAQNNLCTMYCMGL